MRFVYTLLCILSLDLLIHITAWRYQYVSSGTVRSRSRLGMISGDPSSLTSCVLPMDLDIVKYALSGAAAGGCRAFSRAFTFPFDTIKTFQQSNSGTKKEKAIIRNYFSGILPAVSSAIPANALFFVVYNMLEQYSFHSTDVLFHCELHDSNAFKLLMRMLISAIATLPQNGIKIPAELLKQRAQLRPSASLSQLAEEAMSEEVDGERVGIRGLYLGGGAQLLREIPYNCFQMALFELFSEKAAWVYVRFDSSTAAAVIGLFAASLSSVLTQPFDTVKTKLMTGTAASFASNKGRTDKQPTNFLMDNAVVRSSQEIIETEGWQGLFVGLIPRLLIVSIGGMVYFYAAALVEQRLEFS